MNFPKVMKTTIFVLNLKKKKGKSRYQCIYPKIYKTMKMQEWQERKRKRKE